MIHHISVFSFQDGPDKQKNIEAVKAYLERVPSQYPALKNQRIGSKAGETPDLPLDAPVLFGDLVQVADFDTAEEANGYPASEVHAKLAEFSTPLLKKVTVIDYVLEEDNV